LDAARSVVAIEVDTNLARLLPETVRRLRPSRQRSLRVIAADVLDGVDLAEPHSNACERCDPPGDTGRRPSWSDPTKLVANLPYNIAVPAVLTCMQRYPSISSALVLVQAEVAARLAAAPGSRTYGAPSVKTAWFAHAERAGSVGASVFWPAPRVESGLVQLRRRPRPPCAASREQVFAVIDAAFAQRRKALRAALSGWAGSAGQAEQLLASAGIDPGERGERLRIEDFCRLAEIGLSRA
jgi:16S rRNA (adenine1518-N6/adenine1519-N6)-dimethyltransferase